MISYWNKGENVHEDCYGCEQGITHGVDSKHYGSIGCYCWKPSEEQGGPDILDGDEIIRFSDNQKSYSCPNWYKKIRKSVRDRAIDDKEDVKSIDFSEIA